MLFDRIVELTILNDAKPVDNDTTELERQLAEVNKAIDEEVKKANVLIAEVRALNSQGLTQQAKEKNDELGVLIKNAKEKYYPKRDALQKQIAEKKKLVGGGVKITDLRMSFSIEKGATRNPNKCTCRIYNMRKETRELVQFIGNIIILRAGYKGDTGAQTIFAGTVTRYLTVKEGPDWVTNLEMMDGLLEFRDTKVSISYGPGVSAINVMRDLAGRFNLPVRTLPDGLPQKQYAQGFAFTGRLREAMDSVCDYLGLEWSIQNREVQIISKGGIFKQKALLLSPSTGMIGSPEQEAKTMTDKAAAKEGITKTQRGVATTFKLDKDGNKEERLRVLGFKVKSLLQPTLQPGGYVQIKSVGIDGEFFRIEALTHNGDTHGTEYMTELTLRYV